MPLQLVGATAGAAIAFLLPGALALSLASWRLHSSLLQVNTSMEQVRVMDPSKLMSVLGTYMAGFFGWLLQQ